MVLTRGHGGHNEYFLFGYIVDVNSLHMESMYGVTLWEHSRDYVPTQEMTIDTFIADILVRRDSSITEVIIDAWVPN
jgi:hypothetical protein